MNFTCTTAFLSSVSLSSKSLSPRVSPLTQMTKYVIVYLLNGMLYSPNKNRQATTTQNCKDLINVMLGVHTKNKWCD